MNATKKTAGEAAKERLIVAVCDVFDICKDTLNVLSMLEARKGGAQ